MAQPDYYGTTPPRGVLRPVLLLLLAFALGIVATVLAVRHWDRIASLIRPTPVVQPVRQIVAARPASPPPPPPNDPALDERIAAVESRMDAIDARAAEASGDADRAEGLLVAFAARRALDRGQPLGYIEGILRERFGGTDALSVAQIIAAAQRPVTLAQLRDGLDSLRSSLVARGGNQRWWQGLRQEMASLLVVRHAGQPSSIPSDRLARAEHALEQGQVDSAADEVARMPGAARANDWLAQARRYVLARNALDRIETAALLAPAPRVAPPVPTD